MAWTSLCELDEVPPDRGFYVEVSGFQLAVFRDGDRIAVMDNTCPHAGANLAGGFVQDGCAVCPKHFWAFRLDNGELRDMPGGARVRTYPVRLLTRDGQTALVQADLPMY